MKVSLQSPLDNKYKLMVDLAITFKLSTKEAAEFLHNNVEPIPTPTIEITDEEAKSLTARGWTTYNREPVYEWRKEQDEALLKAEEWVKTLSEEEQDHIKALLGSMMPTG